MIAELKNGDRAVSSGIPPAYIGRVGIEGRATLVIENITSQDNAFFQCTLRVEPASGLQNQISTIRLIVTGMFGIIINLVINISKQGVQEFYYIHTEIYTLKSRRVNFRSQTDVNQSNVAYRFSHM